MARQTYVGIKPEHAVAAFDALLPHVLLIRGMQGKCAPMGADDFALEIAVQSLETSAYHFTRRVRFYDQTRVRRAFGQNYFEGLGDRTEAGRAFVALRPYWADLSRLQQQCSPFGRDYLAIDIAKQGLETAAYHFTHAEHFYGTRGDSAGRGPDMPWDIPLRPGRG